METTTLYVELLIIGLEVCVWLGLLLLGISGTRCPGAVPVRLDDYALLVTLGTFGMAYLLGILFDKVAKFLLGAERRYIQRLVDGSASRTVLEEDDEDVRQIYARTAIAEGRATSLMLYARSKVRILRASVLNVPLIAIAAAIYLASAWKVEWWPVVPAAIVFWLITAGAYIYTQRLYRARLQRFKKYLEKPDA